MDKILNLFATWFLTERRYHFLVLGNHSSLCCLFSYVSVPRVHSIELAGIGLIFTDLILKLKKHRF